MNPSKVGVCGAVMAMLVATTEITTAGSNAITATAEVHKASYERTAEPVVKPALLPLPPGAVEPSGWLRDWARAARDGITGHLDEMHPVYRDGWKGFRVDAPNAKPDGTGWPLEQSAYWLDGALRLGFVLHDDRLIGKIRARLDPIVDGVNRAPSGTSFIYWKPDYSPAGFDSWAHSHMGRALVALYDATREQRVLDALVKVYANYPTNMGTLELGGNVSGLCNLDPMLETYSFSGDRRILERARQAMGQPEVAQSIQAWQQQQLKPGHMVILYENIRLPAVLYPWSGDPHLLQATVGAFQWLDSQHMLPYGVASGEEFASGVGAFRKTETCDVAAMLLSASWMYRIQGNSACGDQMEQAFFNAGPAAVARDFKTMCYYQSPNRLRSDGLPMEQPFCPGPPNTRFTTLGCSNVLCCVGALNRVIPSFIIHMWAATHDKGLAAALYGPCTVSARVGEGVPVRIDSRTDYPFEETVRLQVHPQTTVSFPLYLRVPGWCARPQVTVNHSKLSAATDERGFVKVDRPWAEGDVVELKFPMAPRVLRGHETAFPSANREYFRFEPPEVFQPRRLPFASVLYGPLLFALPIPDLDANTPAANARWQFALDTDRADGDPGLKIERQSMPVHWDWPLESPLTIQAPARSFDWQPTDAQALPDNPVSGGASETIRLVPYGCTKFRISMLPVTSRAWNPVRAEPRLDLNSQRAHAQLLAKAKGGRIDIYFEGDSITRRWGATDPQYEALLENWNENFFGWNAANFGWGGDTVQNILWRLENGELDGVHPRIIVLMAGTNNLELSLGVNDDEAKVEQVTRGIEAILSVMQQKAPAATVILMGITPRTDRRGGATLQMISRINERISHLADGNSIRYLDINNQLADGNGAPLEGMTVDGLHLTMKGYQVWADALKPIFTELLGPRAQTDHAPPPTGDPSAQQPATAP